LYPANLSATQEIDAAPATRDAAAYPLLFDPQTAGGFIAAVPPDRSKDCLAALQAAGYGSANIVGVLRAPAPGDSRLCVN
jgi:selenide,water dikinase